MKIIVIGLGSIGNRHFNNLKELGHDVIGIDINEEIDFSSHYDFAVIATPTETHVSIANQFFEHGIPCFIEKPIAETEEQLNLIKPYKVINMVACNLRFTNVISSIKKESKGILNIHSRVCDSSLFRTKYGDMILQDIHEFDYLSWIMGDIKHIDIIRGQNNKSYDAIILFESGRTASVHGDMEAKSYHRSIFAETKYGNINDDIDISNDMYVKQMQYFIECVKEKTMPENTVEQASKLTRRLLEAIHRCDNPSSHDIEKTFSKSFA